MVHTNKNNGRGMRVGMWDGLKDVFLCIKGPKFYMYELYEMPHFEDDDGTVIFEPLVNITELLELDKFIPKEKNR